jgi:hypothetical protein
MHFIYRKNKLQDEKMTISRGNILEIFFGWGLCFSFCSKNTLQSCTKTSLQRNQRNGVLTVGSRIWCFLYTLHTERTNRRTKKWPCHAEISWKRSLS